MKARRIWSFIADAGFAMGLVFLTALAIWRLQGVDRLAIDWALVTYATPWILLFVAALCGSLLLRWLRRQSCELRWAYSILSCVLAVLWLRQSFRWQSADLPIEGAKVVRLVFWNADQFEYGTIAEQARKLAGLDGDLYVLAESVVDYGTQQRVFPATFPNHAYKILGAGNSLVHRSELSIGAQSFEWFNRWRSHCLVVEWQTPSGPFDLVIFDQPSDLDSDRAVPIARLAAFLEARREQTRRPTLLVGDFNTPAESAALEPLRETGWVRAFEQNGQGFGETWPLPIPLLALDQCWVREEEIRILSARHQSLDLLGHQALVVEWQLP